MLELTLFLSDFGATFWLRCFYNYIPSRSVSFPNIHRQKERWDFWFIRWTMRLLIHSLLLAWQSTCHIQLACWVAQTASDRCHWDDRIVARTIEIGRGYWDFGSGWMTIASMRHIWDRNASMFGQMKMLCCDTIRWNTWTHVWIRSITVWMRFGISKSVWFGNACFGFDNGCVGTNVGG